jgi:hypothetical protein
MQVVAALVRTPTGFGTRHLIQGGFMSLRSAHDSSVIDADEVPTLGVRTAFPGRPPTEVSIAATALASLSADVLGGIAAHVLDPPTLSPIEPIPPWPVIWHIHLTTDRRRQIGLFGLPGGLRFGLVDLHSGAFAALVARFADTTMAVAIESYGPAASCVEELSVAIDGWVSAGSPAVDRLGLSIDYHDAHAEPLMSLGWSTGA